MGRILGTLGLATTVDKGKGVYSTSITRISIPAESMTERLSHVSSGQLSDDIRVGHRVGFIFDPTLGFSPDKVVYFEWNAVKWKVESLEMHPPRCVLQLGAVWHE